MTLITVEEFTPSYMELSSVKSPRFITFRSEDFAYAHQTPETVLIAFVIGNEIMRHNIAHKDWGRIYLLLGGTNTSADVQALSTFDPVVLAKLCVAWHISRINADLKRNTDEAMRNESDAWNAIMDYVRGQSIPADLVSAYRLYRDATIERGGARDDETFKALYQPMENARQNVLDVLAKYIPTEETADHE